MAFELYETGRSRSLRVRWMLAEVGAEFTAHTVKLGEGEGQSPAHRARHPLGKVPVLVDGEFTLFESAAIVTYLGDRFPDCGLVPKAVTPQRAHYDQWAHFVMTELDAPLWMAAKHTFFYPEEHRSEALVELYRSWDFNRGLKGLLRQIDKGGYVLGDHFSAVDILAGHTLKWCSAMGWLDDFQSARDYLDRLTARPAFPRELYS